jgi:hypothetical protein
VCACLAVASPGRPPANTELPAALDSNITIRLPRLIDAELPATGTPLAEPHIASGFFGCWEGNPGEFASIIGASGANAPFGLSRVVKCYLPGQIETQEYDLEFAPRHPILDKILRVLGLSSRRVRVKEARTDVYEVSANQVYSRGTMKLEVTEGSLFKWPRATQHTVLDEELATLVNPDLVSISGRAFVTAASRRSVGIWSADLHH